MPALSPHQIALRMGRKKTSEQTTLDGQRRRAEQRERFIDYLSQKHAARLNISYNDARRRVLAVCVTGKPKDEAA
jgi:hypothetical protein